jgi:hypothetical protein
MNPIGFVHGAFHWCTSTCTGDASMLSLVPQALDNPGTVKWFSQITGFGFMAPDHASIDGVDHVRKIHGMASGAVNLRFR